MGLELVPALILGLHYIYTTTPSFSHWTKNQNQRKRVTWDTPSRVNTLTAPPPRSKSGQVHRKAPLGLVGRNTTQFLALCPHIGSGPNCRWFLWQEPPPSPQVPGRHTSTMPEVKILVRCVTRLWYLVSERRQKYF